MKITLESKEDIKAVNWLNVRERIINDVIAKIADALTRAADQISELEPGEVREISLELGQITISREPFKAA